MNISFAAGRNFESGQPNHERIVINETAAERLGFKSAQEAIGQKVDFYTRWPGEPSTIIGVVRNYYQRSPKENFIPMVYHYNEWVSFIVVKTRTEDVASTIAAIKNTFNNNYPNSTFDYFFIDEMYNDQYLRKPVWQSGCHLLGPSCADCLPWIVWIIIIHNHPAC